jgi:hypothetical protein
VQLEGSVVRRVHIDRSLASQQLDFEVVDHRLDVEMT